MTRPFLRLMTATLATSVFPSVVWAQSGLLAQAPARLTGEDSAAVTWVVAVALILVVTVTAFINPKRSHRA